MKYITLCIVSLENKDLKDKENINKDETELDNIEIKNNGYSM